MTIMKITDIFKNSNNSNEEKFIKKLSEYDSDKFQNSAPFKKFERMRQSWNYENRTGLYFKIKNGEYITEQDIKTITDDAKDKGVSSTEEFKFYIKALKGIVDTQEISLEKGFINMDEEIKAKKRLEDLSDKLTECVLNLKDLSNRSYSEELQQHAEKLVLDARKTWREYNICLENVKNLLFDTKNKKRNKEDYRQSYIASRNRLRVAKEIQEWMYGKDNFYQKGAQKFFSKHMNVCELSLKCDKKKLENYLKKLDSDEKYRIKIIYSMLMGFSIEAYGKDNKYMKKYEELEKAFM